MSGNVNCVCFKKKKNQNHLIVTLATLPEAAFPLRTVKSLRPWIFHTVPHFLSVAGAALVIMLEQL